MDNNAQNQDDQQVATPQRAAPVSGPHKEAAPVGERASEYLQAAEVKPELSQEEVKAGVEHAPEDKPHIPYEVAKAGVSHAKETVIHPVEPSGVVSFPSTTQQQALVMKKRPVHDAAKWLATFILRQFDKIAYQKLPVKK